MKKPGKILVPVDLSERSGTGLAYAAMLAEGLGSELVVMINVNLQEREGLEDFAAAEQISVPDAAEAALRRVILDRAPEAKSSIVVRSDAFPADSILWVAENETVDMIVIASHGRSGMTRWMLGSVAEKIARNSAVPVVVVPARE